MVRIARLEAAGNGPEAVFCFFSDKNDESSAFAEIDAAPLAAKRSARGVAYRLERGKT